ncbi:Glucosidase 2 subunit beta like protein [Argiope bruennichi]|uniref:Glucosidase 2 subunit beta like protein n=2 Tax=Argiope bruennichi TaxID=94029 RepID=A0A8T0FXG5_ARGBR|nr:Glucosidase 2 subunit beta like protein [Argiope bruennichi]
MYQLFSVGQLGKELSRRNPRPRLQTNFKNYEKADGFMQSKSADKEIKDDAWHASLNTQENTKFILGVLPSSQRFYKPTPRNTFKCIESGEEINFAFVNDNFCDCSDFSDEPSTSACNSGKFYCTHQSKHSISSVLSYKVNDGICDCCDGSDEWLHITLPEHTLVPGNKQKGIFQVPCPVNCIS